jgi:hypothetical protein
MQIQKRSRGGGTEKCMNKINMRLQSDGDCGWFLKLSCLAGIVISKRS